MLTADKARKKKRKQTKVGSSLGPNSYLLLDKEIFNERLNRLKKASCQTPFTATINKAQARIANISNNISGTVSSNENKVADKTGSLDVCARDGGHKTVFVNNESTRLRGNLQSSLHRRQLLSTLNRAKQERKNAEMGYRISSNGVRVATRPADGCQQASQILPGSSDPGLGHEINEICLERLMVNAEASTIYDDNEEEEKEKRNENESSRLYITSVDNVTTLCEKDHSQRRRRTVSILPPGECVSESEQYHSVSAKSTQDDSVRTVRRYVCAPFEEMESYEHCTDRATSRVSGEYIYKYENTSETRTQQKCTRTNNGKRQVEKNKQERASDGHKQRCTVQQDQYKGNCVHWQRANESLKEIASPEKPEYYNDNQKSNSIDQEQTEHTVRSQEKNWAQKDKQDVPVNHAAIYANVEMNINETDKELKVISVQAGFQREQKTYVGDIQKGSPKTDKISNIDKRLQLKLEDYTENILDVNIVQCRQEYIDENTSEMTEQYKYHSAESCTEVQVDLKHSGHGISTPVELDHSGHGIGIPVELDHSGHGISTPVELDHSGHGIGIPVELEHSGHSTDVSVKLEHSGYSIDVPAKIEHSGYSIDVPVKLEHSGHSINVPVKLEHSGHSIDVLMKLEHSGHSINLPVKLEHSGHSICVPVKLAHSEHNIKIPVKLEDSEHNMEVPVNLEHSRQCMEIQARLEHSDHNMEVQVKPEHNIKVTERQECFKYNMEVQAELEHSQQVNEIPFEQEHTLHKNTFSWYEKRPACNLKETFQQEDTSGKLQKEPQVNGQHNLNSVSVDVRQAVTGAATIIEGKTVQSLQENARECAVVGLEQLDSIDDRLEWDTYKYQQEDKDLGSLFVESRQDYIKESLALTPADDQVHQTFENVQKQPLDASENMDDRDEGRNTKMTQDTDYKDCSDGYSAIKTDSTNILGIFSTGSGDLRNLSCYNKFKELHADLIERLVSLNRDDLCVDADLSSSTSHTDYSNEDVDREASSDDGEDCLHQVEEGECHDGDDCLHQVEEGECHNGEDCLHQVEEGECHNGEDCLHQVEEGECHDGEDCLHQVEEGECHDGEDCLHQVEEDECHDGEDCLHQVEEGECHDGEDCLHQVEEGECHDGEDCLHQVEEGECHDGEDCLHQVEEGECDEPDDRDSLASNTAGSDSQASQGVVEQTTSQRAQVYAGLAGSKEDQLNKDEPGEKDCPDRICCNITDIQSRPDSLPEKTCTVKRSGIIEPSIVANTTISQTDFIQNREGNNECSINESLKLQAANTSTACPSLDSSSQYLQHTTSDTNKRLVLQNTKFDLTKEYKKYIAEELKTCLVPAELTHNKSDSLQAVQDQREADTSVRSCPQREIDTLVRSCSQREADTSVRSCPQLEADTSVRSCPQNKADTLVRSLSQREADISVRSCLQRYSASYHDNYESACSDFLEVTLTGGHGVNANSRKCTPLSSSYQSKAVIKESLCQMNEDRHFGTVQTDLKDVPFISGPQFDISDNSGLVRSSTRNSSAVHCQHFNTPRSPELASSNNTARNSPTVDDQQCDISVSSELASSNNTARNSPTVDDQQCDISVSSELASSSTKNSSSVHCQHFATPVGAEFASSNTVKKDLKVYTQYIAAPSFNNTNLAITKIAAPGKDFCEISSSKTSSVTDVCKLLTKSCDQSEISTRQLHGCARSVDLADLVETVETEALPCRSSTIGYRTSCIEKSHRNRCLLMSYPCTRSHRTEDNYKNVSKCPGETTLCSESQDLAQTRKRDKSAKEATNYDLSSYGNTFHPCESRQTNSCVLDETYSEDAASNCTRGQTVLVSAPPESCKDCQPVSKSTTRLYNTLGITSRCSSDENGQETTSSFNVRHLNMRSRKFNYPKSKWSKETNINTDITINSNTDITINSNTDITINSQRTKEFESLYEEENTFLLAQHPDINEIMSDTSLISKPCTDREIGDTGDSEGKESEREIGSDMMYIHDHCKLSECGSYDQGDDQCPVNSETGTDDTDIWHSRLSPLDGVNVTDDHIRAEDKMDACTTRSELLSLQEKTQRIIVKNILNLKVAKQTASKIPQKIDRSKTVTLNEENVGKDLLSCVVTGSKINVSAKPVPNKIRYRPSPIRTSKNSRTASDMQHTRLAVSSPCKKCPTTLKTAKTGTKALQPAYSNSHQQPVQSEWSTSEVKCSKVASVSANLARGQCDGTGSVNTDSQRHGLLKYQHEQNHRKLAHELVMGAPIRTATEQQTTTDARLTNVTKSICQGSEHNSQVENEDTSRNVTNHYSSSAYHLSMRQYMGTNRNSNYSELLETGTQSSISKSEASGPGTSKSVCTTGVPCEHFLGVNTKNKGVLTEQGPSSLSEANLRTCIAPNSEAEEMKILMEQIGNKFQQSSDYKTYQSSDDYKPQQSSDDYKPQQLSDDYKPYQSSDDDKLYQSSDDYKPQQSSDDYKPYQSSDDYKPYQSSDNYKPQQLSDDYKPQQLSDDVLNLLQEDRGFSPKVQLATQVDGNYFNSNFTDTSSNEEIHVQNTRFSRISSRQLQGERSPHDRGDQVTNYSPASETSKPDNWHTSIPVKSIHSKEEFDPQNRVSKERLGVIFETDTFGPEDNRDKEWSDYLKQTAAVSGEVAYCNRGSASCLTRHLQNVVTTSAVPWSATDTLTSHRGNHKFRLTGLDLYRECVQVNTRNMDGLGQSLNTGELTMEKLNQTLTNDGTTMIELNQSLNAVGLINADLNQSLNVDELTMDKLNQSLNDDRLINDELNQSLNDGGLINRLNQSPNTDGTTMIELNHSLNVDGLINDELNQPLNADELINNELNQSLNADELNNDELNQPLNADELNNDELNQSLNAEEAMIDKIEHSIKVCETAADIQSSNSSTINLPKYTHNLPANLSGNLLDTTDACVSDRWFLKSVHGNGGLVDIEVSGMAQHDGHRGLTIVNETHERERATFKRMIKNIVNQSYEDSTTENEDDILEGRSDIHEWNKMMHSAAPIASFVNSRADTLRQLDPPSSPYEKNYKTTSLDFYKGSVLDESRTDSYSHNLMGSSPGFESARSIKPTYAELKASALTKAYPVLSKVKVLSGKCTTIAVSGQSCDGHVGSSPAGISATRPKIIQNNVAPKAVRKVEALLEITRSLSQADLDQSAGTASETIAISTRAREGLNHRQDENVNNSKSDHRVGNSTHATRLRQPRDSDMSTYCCLDTMDSCSTSLQNSSSIGATVSVIPIGQRSDQSETLKGRHRKCRIPVRKHFDESNLMSGKDNETRQYWHSVAVDKFSTNVDNVVMVVKNKKGIQCKAVAALSIAKRTLSYKFSETNTANVTNLSKNIEVKDVKATAQVREDSSSANGSLTNVDTRKKAPLAERIKRFQEKRSRNIFAGRRVKKYEDSQVTASVGSKIFADDTSCGSDISLVSSNTHVQDSKKFSKDAPPHYLNIKTPTGRNTNSQLPVKIKLQKSLTSEASLTEEEQAVDNNSRRFSALAMQTSISTSASVFAGDMCDTGLNKKETAQQTSTVSDQGAHCASDVVHFVTLVKDNQSKLIDGNGVRALGISATQLPADCPERRKQAVPEPCKQVSIRQKATVTTNQNHERLKNQKNKSQPMFRNGVAHAMGNVCTQSREKVTKRVVGTTAKQRCYKRMERPAGIGHIEMSLGRELISQCELFSTSSSDQDLEQPLSKNTLADCVGDKLYKSGSDIQLQKGKYSFVDVQNTREGTRNKLKDKPDMDAFLVSELLGKQQKVYVKQSPLSREGPNRDVISVGFIGKKNNKLTDIHESCSHIHDSCSHIHDPCSHIHDSCSHIKDCILDKDNWQTENAFDRVASQTLIRKISLERSEFSSSPALQSSKPDFYSHTLQYSDSHHLQDKTVPMESAVSGAVGQTSIKSPHKRPQTEISQKMTPLLPRASVSFTNNVEVLQQSGHLRACIKISDTDASKTHKVFQTGQERPEDSYESQRAAPATWRARTNTSVLNPVAASKSPRTSKKHEKTKSLLSERLALTSAESSFISNVKSKEDSHQDVSATTNSYHKSTVMWSDDIKAANKLANVRLDNRHVGGRHTDGRHTDGRHTDGRHTDGRHTNGRHTHIGQIDERHAHVGYEDGRHSDVVHEDGRHSDVGHRSGRHSDVVHEVGRHSDVVHEVGRHSDVVHEDGRHSDVVHEDGRHSDVVHEDGRHSDVVHEDGRHSDVGHRSGRHSDVGHEDSRHSNVGHVDGRHSRVGYVDGRHSRVGYMDGRHSRIGHVDGGNSRVGNVDGGHSGIGHVDGGNSRVGHVDGRHSDEEQVRERHPNVRQISKKNTNERDINKERKNERHVNRIHRDGKLTNAVSPVDDQRRTPELTNREQTGICRDEPSTQPEVEGVRLPKTCSRGKIIVSSSCHSQPVRTDDKHTQTPTPSQFSHAATPDGLSECYLLRDVLSGDSVTPVAMMNSSHSFSPERCASGRNNVPCFPSDYLKERLQQNTCTRSLVRFKADLNQMHNSSPDSQELVKGSSKITSVDSGATFIYDKEINKPRKGKLTLTNLQLHDFERLSPVTEFETIRYEPSSNESSPKMTFRYSSKHSIINHSRNSSGSDTNQRSLATSPSTQAHNVARSTKVTSESAKTTLPPLSAKQSGLPHRPSYKRYY